MPACTPCPIPKSRDPHSAMGRIFLKDILQQIVEVSRGACTGLSVCVGREGWRKGGGGSSTVINFLLCFLRLFHVFQCLKPLSGKGLEAGMQLLQQPRARRGRGGLGGGILGFACQSQLCVLTLIRCPFNLRVTAVTRKATLSFCQKCRWQVTPKHAYTLDPTKLKWADYAAVQE